MVGHFCRIEDSLWLWLALLLRLLLWLGSLRSSWRRWGWWRPAWRAIGVTHDLSSTVCDSVKLGIVLVGVCVLETETIKIAMFLESEVDAELCNENNEACLRPLLAYRSPVALPADLRHKSLRRLSPSLSHSLLSFSLSTTTSLDKELEEGGGGGR